MNAGLIFDLDGTLVDSLAGIAASLNRALLIENLPSHSERAVRGYIGNGARILVERAVAPRMDPRQIDRIETAFKADYDTTWPEGTRVFEGISSMLETLAAEGYPLAVLSNKPHPFTLAIVESLFPGIRFSAVLGQRDGIPHKPDPGGALEIAKLLEIPPPACIVVGDSTMDIETARNAGMQSIGVSWGFQDRDLLVAARPDCIVASYVELTERIRQIRFSSST